VRQQVLLLKPNSETTGFHDYPGFPHQPRMPVLFHVSPITEGVIRGIEEHGLKPGPKPGRPWSASSA